MFHKLFNITAHRESVDNRLENSTVGAIANKIYGLFQRQNKVTSFFFV